MLFRSVFSAGKSDISWTVEHLGIRVEMTLLLPTHDVAELWTIKVTNLTGATRKISVYPYFPFGYMSWMYQEGEWNEKLGGLVATCNTPYQKMADYWKMKHFKDKSYFLCETKPDSFDARQKAFEGEGGLHAPDGVYASSLRNTDARYETPTAAVQYRIQLAPKAEQEYRFLFGPAKDEAEIEAMRKKFLSKDAFTLAAKNYDDYIERGSGCLHIETPDKGLDNFVNNWLARQVFYHGDVNRLKIGRAHV